MKNRIQKFLDVEQISASKFADEIGVQRSSISHILSGRNNPSLEVIQKILSRFDDLNPEWLVTGKGDMYKPNRQPTLFDRISEPVKEDRQILKNKDVQNETTMNVSIDNKETLPTTKSEILDTSHIVKVILLYDNGKAAFYEPV